MNNKFEKVAQIAKAVNMTEAARAVGEGIQTVTSRKDLHIAVTGGQNSGKTTIINAIAGREVREVSNISEENERPLKMSFERSKEDDRFECVDIFDPTWNGMDTAIFEMKDTDLVNDGLRTDLAHEVDVVFYLISALSAFTGSDVANLKALKNHKIVLVLTKLDAIEEEDKDGVLKYVENISKKLGLEAPIVMDKRNADDVSKLFLRAIPSFMERAELKEAYCQAILDELTCAVKEALNAKISSMGSTVAMEEENAVMQTTRSRALVAKNQILELGAARVRGVDKSDKLATVLAKRMAESGQAMSYSEGWKVGIKKKIIDPLFAEEFVAERDQIRKSLIRDCSGIDITEEERKQLERKVDEVLGGSVQVTAVKDFGSKAGKVNINLATVGITAAVVAGALWVPVPTVATWLISVGAVAVGTGAVINEKTKAEQAEWNKQINLYAKVVAKQFCDGLKIYNNRAYEEMADFVYSSQIKDGYKTLQQRSDLVNAEKEKYLCLLAELD